MFVGFPFKPRGNSGQTLCELKWKSVQHFFFAWICPQGDHIVHCEKPGTFESERGVIDNYAGMTAMNLNQMT